MKRMMFAIAVAASLAVRADTSADVLMWYIDTTEAADSTIQGTDFQSFNFYAKSVDDPAQTVDLRAKTYTSMENLIAGGASDWSAGIQGDGFAGWYYTDLRGSSLERYELMMTLYNGGSIAAWSASMYNPDADKVMLSTPAVAAAVYSISQLQGNDLNPNPTTVQNAFNFGAGVVPEPTGGLLMLVGGALLALRRKRAVA